MPELSKTPCENLVNTRSLLISVGLTDPWKYKQSQTLFTPKAKNAGMQMYYFLIPLQEGKIKGT